MKVFIWPSTNSWGSSNISVVKKDGGLRMRVDKSAMNKASIKYNYPFPRIDDVWDQFGRPDSFRQ
jgi:hypothetical protein